MERKLVTVRKIDRIEPIEGADQIEKAIVGGWNIVVKKGEFKEGDFALYYEIDSFLPIKEEYEFLRKSSLKRLGDLEGFRLKTIKLRGVTSQGLLLPLDILRKYTSENPDPQKDYSEILGVIKYEAPIPACLAGKIKGNFPAFLVKTDEERIQNLSDVYENFKKNTFYVAEKLDGSSASFYLNNGVFGVCSRNIDLLETSDNSFWKVARDLDIENKLESIGRNICIQGELIGEGIQGNPYKLTGQTVKFFNMFYIDEQRFATLGEFLADMPLTLVPILDYNYTLPDTIEELIQFADGKSELNKGTDREGLVIRSHSRNISFKVISNKFLLKEKN